MLILDLLQAWNEGMNIHQANTAAMPVEIIIAVLVMEDIAPVVQRQQRLGISIIDTTLTWAESLRRD